MNDRTKDADYFARRESTHRELASATEQSQIARIHSALAEAYRRKAEVARTSI